MKSGTNQFHGSGYEYFVNEALNAGTPYTDEEKDTCCVPASGATTMDSARRPGMDPQNLRRPRPDILLLQLGQFRENTVINNFPTTVPTLRYRTGDFGQALTGRNWAPMRIRAGRS